MRLLGLALLPHLKPSQSFASALSMTHGQTSFSSSIPQDVASVLQHLYAQPKPAKLCVSTTGAGGQAVAWLMGIPGASSSLLEATAPYCRASGKQWTGLESDSAGACSVEAAQGLAETALKRGLELAFQEEGFSVLKEGVVGVGCTAAVASTQPKKGSHRAHVAYSTSGGKSCVLSLTLTKGQRSREEEDWVVSRLIVRAIAEGAGVDLPEGYVVTGLAEGEEVPVGHQVDGEPALARIADGAAKLVLVTPGCTPLVDHPIKAPALVFPGSFNPLHKGHEELLNTALRVYKRDVLSGIAAQVPALFEMSVVNADKGSLPLNVIETRAKQFTRFPVALTNAPLFAEKGALFPGCGFVMGSDTAARLIDKKYYGNSVTEMVSALSKLQQQGCHIIVGGRALTGKFVSLEEILVGCPSLPESLKAMFIGLPEEDFRVDLSSTELRAQVSAAK
ncbi:unnamed protein product [Chrysoparadoxa australica]